MHRALFPYNSISSYKRVKSTMDADKPFLTTIEGVFKVLDRGIVINGQIKQGVARKGE
jgi:translation elongation factor EF-Tu-like GTPase